MSKKAKLEAKLRSMPSDFHWDELVTLLGHYDFTMHSTKGGSSHFTFLHPTGFKVKISRTHPHGLLKKYQIEAAIDALDRATKLSEHTPSINRSGN